MTRAEKHQNEGRRDAVRITPLAEGPLLVEGPVELVLPDGTVRRSDRPVVALCRCRRTLNEPFCDTSHRPRSRHRPTGTRTETATGSATGTRTGKETDR
ncbi:CDGSH iron-sulfur domain-containing protein [Streptomyces sp. NPDC014779]|uniref:CDGSH iron-sulfur domain-containing protein n=1 Tax=unclassified Streptomyces TaxID=2593676 RepID=UPI00370027A3